MFYHVSKIGWFFLEPSNLLLSLALFGLLLGWTRFLRAGRWLANISLAALLIMGLSPAANWLILPLESRFPVPDLTDRRIDGVIVLGGTVQERQTLAHASLTLNDAGERVVAMADLARRYPDARILFTGGAGAYSRAPKPEADVLEAFIGTLGLPAGRIATESRSVNTYENAVFSKELMQPKAGETWLLVTSAWHMPRSAGIFRAAGWPVLAYPVDFRTAGSKDRTRGFASVSDGLRRTEVATREWLGLLVYWLTGKTDALFPAP
ncbi:MAG: YdcF family protein [Methylocystis sp.]|nr:YdcF family protein [Methylocystis sp.]